jgi:uncharacterized protein
LVKILDNIIDIINKFIDNSSKDNINISEVILFGSYAKGTNHEWSDIDIAVVSNDFESVRLFDNKKI